MTYYVPNAYGARCATNQANIMMQPGGFRAVTGGPSLFGTGYQYGCGYGGYGYGYGYEMDDGKISAGKKIGCFFKGIGKTITGAVKSLFTPKGLLTAAACIGLCVVTGGAAAPILAGIGIAKGALTVGKGVYQASTATTDAEAMAAWENIGGGTFEVAASAVAMKGATSSLKASTGQATTGAAMKSAFNNSRAGNVYTGIKQAPAGSKLKTGFAEATKGTKIETFRQGMQEAQQTAQAAGKKAGLTDQISSGWKKTFGQNSTGSQTTFTQKVSNGWQRVKSSFGKGKQLKSDLATAEQNLATAETNLKRAQTAGNSKNSIGAYKGQVRRAQNKVTSIQNQINAYNQNRVTGYTAGLSLVDQGNEERQSSYYYV